MQILETDQCWICLFYKISKLTYGFKNLQKSSPKLNFELKQTILHLCIPAYKVWTSDHAYFLGRPLFFGPLGPGAAAAARLVPEPLPVVFFCFLAGPLLSPAAGVFGTTFGSVLVTTNPSGKAPQQKLYASFPGTWGGDEVMETPWKGLRHSWHLKQQFSYMVGYSCR